LPSTFRKDWVINANDSYWLPNPEQPLEGFATIIGCEQCERTLRTRMVYHYVLDRIAGTDGLAAGKRVSPRTLRLFEHTNRVFGAELARENGDLDAVCEAAEGGNACTILKNWDGRSDIDSVGTHIFQEFWRQVIASGVDPWQVPFDAADPVGTPRDLNETDATVIAAMADALADIKARGFAFNAPWGQLQVAGDEGAPPIPIGGGEGFAGNANAVSSRLTVTNLKRMYPVTYGSSHIQAIAFLDGGGLDARTILTYSQSTDPTSPWSYDQTKLFSREKWVRFAFTTTQIRNGAIATYWVSGKA
jgi:acyl-homoserine-lactone acylase